MKTRTKENEDTNRDENKSQISSEEDATSEIESSNASDNEVTEDCESSTDSLTPKRRREAPEEPAEDNGSTLSGTATAGNQQALQESAAVSETAPYPI